MPRVTVHYAGGSWRFGEPKDLPKDNVLVIVMESGYRMGSKEYLIYDPSIDVWIPTDSDACALRHEGMRHPVFHGVTVTDREWRALLEKLDGE